MRNRDIIGKNQTIIFLMGIKFNNRTTPHTQELVNGNGRLPQLNGNINRNIVKICHNYPFRDSHRSTMSVINRVLPAKVNEVLTDCSEPVPNAL